MKDTTSTSVPYRISWIDLINESVHTYDDFDKAFSCIISSLSFLPIFAIF
jgi:hypothetical protein